MKNEEMLTLGNEDINNEAGDFTALEEGLYQAVCVGITVKEMDNYEKTGKEDKIQFVFQIIDNETPHYVRSKPLKKSLHEKAGLWKLLASWTKQPNAETLISKMGTNGKFDIRYFIGKPIQLTIKQKEYKGKEYPEISDYMAPKKGVLIEAKMGGIPPFIVKDVKAQYLAEGMFVKEFKVKEAEGGKPEATQKPAVTSEEVDVEDSKDPSDLPF